MSNDRVWVRNTLTGQTGVIPRKLFEHAVLSGGALVEVEPGSKSYVPEMYRPRTVEQYESDFTPDEIETPVNHDSEDAS